MNFSISKESLVRLSFLTSSLAQKKGSMPILANVLLEATKDGLLKVMATDLSVSLKSQAQADVTVPGKTTVEAKVLYEIVKELPDFPVSVNLSKRSKLEIECGQSRFRINSIYPEEFPEPKGLELQEPATIKTKTLLEMIDNTLYAASTDETRFNINGIFVETIEGPLGPGKMCLRFVATDGHRMAIIDRSAEGVELEKSVIIPRKGAQELKKVLEEFESEDANISLTNEILVIEIGETTLGIRLIDGHYPNYREVIPTETTTSVSVDRDEILSVVKRIALVTSDKSKAIKLKLSDGNLLLSSASPEYGEALENLDVEQKGQNVSTGFSARYLIDIINTVPSGKKVIIKFNGDDYPGIFSSDSDALYEGVIMPMRFE